jgi:hypothetical protein
MRSERRRLTPCPLTPRERALLREAQRRCAEIYEHGSTPEQLAQAWAELNVPRSAPQPQLPLKVDR